MLYLVTEDWYFVSHRLPVARTAQRAGFDVHIATRITDHLDFLQAEGFTVHKLGWRRRGDSPLHHARSIFEINRVVSKVKPNVLHAVALKSVVFGSLATLFSPIDVRIHAITGLGYVFTDKRLRTRLIRSILRFVFRLAVNKPNSIIVFQNHDDGLTLRTSGFIRRSRTRVIRGSGVDVDRFAPMPAPQNSAPVIAMVARMIAIKGVQPLVEASCLLSEQGVRHKLILVGAPDTDNATSFREADLRKWSEKPNIEWKGSTTDVLAVWRNADIAALTSYGGEGIPLSLLEAASCARPILSTDVPGNREIAVHGYNAEVAPPGDVPKIAERLRTLINDPELRARYSKNSRRLVTEHFQENLIVGQTLALYGGDIVLAEDAS